MALTPGTRLGVYEVTARLGEGGMGQVYRARDTKLNRDVALKVLPDSFANDADRLARFTREAQTLASLNHPNIAAIYGLEEGLAGQAGLASQAGPTGPTHCIALVMELVEGTDLSDRIAAGPIPLDEALPIARQIADALEAAHEQGIVHRDLKPANIKIRADGTVKVLDFGLAKASEGAGAPGGRGLSQSPTMTSPAMTQAGMILGTAAYMSPEQARGKSVDKRADIWAFGVVLFEMLTGQRAFKGEEISDLIASVLRDTLDLHALPEATPASVRRLLTRCLERDPKLRLRDIGEARVALSGGGADEDARPASDTVTAPVSLGPRRGRSVAVLPWLVAGLAVAALAVFAVTSRRVVPQPDPFPLRVEVSNPTNAPTGPAALSPDGHTLVYVGRTGPAGPQRMLFVRRLDQLVSRAIPGTEGAGFRSIWWSPDGRWIGFVANRRKLMKVSLEGGAPVALTEVADEGGGTWTPSGEIIIGSGVSEGLQGLLRVSQAGGTLQPFTQIDPARKELSHQSPRVLADGKTVLFSIWYGAPETAELALASLDDGKTVPLGVNGGGPLGVVDGQLIFGRYDGVTMAVPFDVARRRTSGSAVQVLDAVNASGGVVALQHGAMNRAGGLVYAFAADSSRQLLWVNRSGETRPAVAERRAFGAPRISPDGDRVATTIGEGSNASIWIHDARNGTLTPLTGSNGARNAVWSSDGRRVLYVSTQSGRAAFWWQAADGSSAPTLASVPPHNAWNMDLASDDITTVYNAIYSGTSPGTSSQPTFNLESFSLAGKHEVRDIAASPLAIETNARISRDGRLVAYQSDESGRTEIYIRSFPDGNGRTQVSTDGGVRPVWSRDGTVLYYSHEGSIMAARLAREATLRVATRDLVVKGPFREEFDVSPDGSRFLVLEADASDRTLVVIPNWITELRRMTAPVH